MQPSAFETNNGGMESQSFRGADGELAGNELKPIVFRSDFRARNAAIDEQVSEQRRERRNRNYLLNSL